MGMGLTHQSIIWCVFLYILLLTTTDVLCVAVRDSFASRIVVLVARPGLVLVLKKVEHFKLLLLLLLCQLVPVTLLLAYVRHSIFSGKLYLNAKLTRIVGLMPPSSPLLVLSLGKTVMMKMMDGILSRIPTLAIPVSRETGNHRS